MSFGDGSFNRFTATLSEDELAAMRRDIAVWRAEDKAINKALYHVLFWVSFLATIGILTLGSLFLLFC